MATLRYLHTDFWRDTFFMDLSPEDKYFYIYLLTNDVCTQCGIYVFNVKYAAAELGYSIDTVKTLLAKFIDYGKILYNDKNHEIMILNWYKYNLNLNNKNTRVCINTCLKKVKTLSFIKNLYFLCCETYKNEMNLIDELFKGISFSGYRDSMSIIESHKEQSMDSCTSDNKSVIEICEDNTICIEEKSEEPVNNNSELANFCGKDVDKSEKTLIDCGNLLSPFEEESSVIDAFQSNFHPITSTELKILTDWCSKLNSKVVIKAIEIATLRNKKTMPYLSGILRNWLESGIGCIAINNC